jgi:hypothetical protein
MSSLGRKHGAAPSSGFFIFSNYFFIINTIVLIMKNEELFGKTERLSRLIRQLAETEPFNEPLKNDPPADG